MHLRKQKSNLATPICAAGHWHSLFALRADENYMTTPTTIRKICVFFSPIWIDLVWHMQIDLDMPDFEKERNHGNGNCK